jgi:hypothetical protein
VSCTLEETKTEPQAEKMPYKKRRKPCIVCGLPSAGVTSYLFLANGTNKLWVPFCQPHLDKIEAYASPVFENQDAFELFKKEHPGLFKSCVQGKIILFLQSTKTNATGVA